MYSTAFYNFSTFGYLAGLAFFAIHLVKERKTILGIGIFLIACSFLLQTWGMLFRWIEAGSLEVSAIEKTLSQTLLGFSWFVAFSQHPPWSNLYEILVYMSWGIVFITLALEMRWHLSWVRQLGMVFTLLFLGLASLTDSSIRPLVPALKSWWIMIHVISASIAYATGALASVICFLALLKDERVKKSTLVGGTLILMGLLLFSLGGGINLFSHGYFVKLLAKAGQSTIYAMDMSKNNGINYLVLMPYVGSLFIIAISCHVILGIFILIKPPSFKNIKRIYMFCFSIIIISLLLILFIDLTKQKISLEPSIAHHIMPTGDWFISFKSHVWSFGLFLLLVLVETVLLIYLLRPRLFDDRLPQVTLLESFAYKSICLSFFLMTIVLITGALWAHYAWGRYWAWDPKETGALAIWLNYAIYLHTRRTPGLSGPVSSFIGVLGIFVIIIGFLGVNLGLFADGLHTYGNN